MSATDFFSRRRVLLGDLHNHCGISYAHGSLEDALANARLQLDFVSVTGHAAWPDIAAKPMPPEVVAYHVAGFRKLAERWPRYLERIAAADDPGAFATFFSYEIHSFRYGDRTVVSPDPPLTPQTDIDLRQFEQLLRDTDAKRDRRLLLPHHIGYPTGFRGIDWNSVTDRASPLVEIISMHGLAECDGAWFPYLHTMGPLEPGNTMVAGLARQHHFGVVGSTDHHSAHPGSFGYGRTAVWAGECTREAIWRAILERRTYAISGDRIELAFAINAAPLGSQLVAPRERAVDITVRAGGAIDRIDVVRNGSLLESLRPSITQVFAEVLRGLIVVELGWGEKGVPNDWDVTIALDRGTVRAVEPRLRGRDVVDPLDRGDVECRFSSWEPIQRGVHLRTRTVGNPTASTSQTQALALDVACPRSAHLTVRGAGNELTIPVATLLDRACIHHTGGFVSAAIKVHRFIGDAHRLATWCFEDRDDTGRAEDSYYVRVVQANGHGAWSSPIWASRSGKKEGHH